MTTKLTKVLNQGTSNPIVAEILIQPVNILDLFPLSNDIRDKIFSICNDSCKRLLEMKEFEIWLVHENNSIKQDFLLNGLKRIGDDSYETSIIIGLDTKAEAFLQSAKLTIRDCGMLLGLIFGQSFDHKFHIIVEWVKKEFGTSDAFVFWLDGNQKWIKNIIEMRNAIEHPSEKPRGRLHISNIDFNFVGNRTIGNDPVWFLTGESPTSIVSDIKSINNRILHFEQEVIIISLLKKFPEIPVDIREIPENERDPKCPVRLELIPRGLLGE
jgi:hypothetical protein